VIISYKRIVSRPIPKKRSIRPREEWGWGRRATAEEQSLFIAAGEKRKEKTFHKSENPAGHDFFA